MIIPVRCFTCGKVIADKWDHYIAEVEKKKATKPTSDLQEPGTKRFDAVQTAEILSKLGLTRLCCRRMMLGHVELMPII